MTDLRHEWDKRVQDWPMVSRIASDLGLKGQGRHFFCPGCQPGGDSAPELTIQDGGFQCFRCGARGDVVGLVKLARQCDLDTAIHWLENETGETIDPGQLS